MNIAFWIVASFAVYRQSRDMVYQEGPFLFYARLQEWVRQRIDANGGKWYYKGLKCPMCLSFWFAGLAALIYWALFPATNPLEIAVLWLGIAGGAAFLLKLTG